MSGIEAEELTGPFPGLRPFRREESEIFFGREEQVDHLLKKLGHGRFVCVHGPSGCGKSSLVLAGLIAGLETGLLGQGRINWRIATMRPGDRPMRNLAEALVHDNALGPILPAPLLLAALRRGPLGLVEVLGGSRHDGPPVLARDENLLVVVDQFEEIFRFRKAAEVEGANRPAGEAIWSRKEAIRNEADAFVGLLVEAIRQTTEDPSLPLFVVLTMRSDFLGDCALFPGLPETLNDSQFLAPRLNRDQRRAAIEGPCKVFGGSIEPALLARLLNDMGTAPDQLPLMQHALKRLWKTAKDAQESSNHEVEQSVQLKLIDYEGMEGSAGALDRDAQATYEAQDPERRRVAEAMFRLLCERGPDHRDTRRLSRVEEVARVAGVSEELVLAVVAAFRSPDLNFVDLSGDALDIGHESLIRQWKQLQIWLTRETALAEGYRQLLQAVSRHEAAMSEGSEELLRSRSLALAVSWRDGERSRADEWRPGLEWSLRYGSEDDFPRVLDYIKLSEQAARQELDKQKRRKILIGTLGAAVCVLGSLSFLLYQYQARNKLLKTSNDRLNQKNVALTVRTLAASSTNVLAENAPQLGTLLAVEAVRTAGTASDHLDPRDRAELLDAAAYAGDALRRALNALGGLPLSGHTGAIRSMALLQGGRWLATASSDRSVRLWCLDDIGKFPPLVLPHEAPVTNVVASPDGRSLVTASESRPIRLYELGEVLKSDGPPPSPRTLAGFEASKREIAFSGDGRWLFAIKADSTARVWRLGGPGVLPVPYDLELENFANSWWSFHSAISRDGRWLAIVRGNGEIHLWNISGRRPVRWKVHNPFWGRVVTRNVTFSDNGGRLCVTLARGRLLVLDLEADRPVVQVEEVNLFVSGEHGEAIALRAGAPRDHLPDLGAAAAVFSTDSAGRWVLTSPLATRDLRGTARTTDAALWNVAAPGKDAVGYRLKGFPVWIDNRKFFIFGDRTLVVRGVDGAVWVWNLTSPGGFQHPVPLSQKPGRIDDIAMTDDGRWLFAARYNNWIHAWDLTSSNTDASPFVLRGHDHPISAMTLSERSGVRWLVSGGDSGMIRMWNLNEIPSSTSVEPAAVQGSYGEHTVVAVGSDWLAAATDNAGGLLYDLRGRFDQSSAPAKLELPLGQISSFVTSPNGRWLGANTTEGRATVLWMMTDPDPLAHPLTIDNLHGDVIRALSTPDDRWLALLVSAEGRLKLGNTTAYLQPVPGSGVAAAPPIPLLGEAGDLALVGSGRWLLSAGANKANLWDLQASNPAGAPAHTLVGYGAKGSTPPRSSPDGRWLAVVTRSDNVCLWRLDQPGELHLRPIVVPGDGSPLKDVRFDPKSRRLIVLDVDGDVRTLLLDGVGRAAAPDCMPVTGAARLSVIDERGRWLASIDPGRQGISLWDLTADRLAPRALGFLGSAMGRRDVAQPFRALDISTDGRWLVVLVGDSVAAWDLKSLDRPPTILRGHGGSIAHIDVSHGRYLAIAGTDNVVRIWDLKAGGQPSDPIVLRHDEGGPARTVVEAGGRRAVTIISGYENIARFWSLDPETLIGVAGKAVGRNLSDEEWRRFLYWKGTYQETFKGLLVPRDGMNQAAEPTRAVTATDSATHSPSGPVR